MPSAPKRTEGQPISSTTIHAGRRVHDDFAEQDLDVVRRSRPARCPYGISARSFPARSIRYANDEWLRRSRRPRRLRVAAIPYCRRGTAVELLGRAGAPPMNVGSNAREILAQALGIVVLWIDGDVDDLELVPRRRPAAVRACASVASVVGQTSRSDVKPNAEDHDLAAVAAEREVARRPIRAARSRAPRAAGLKTPALSVASSAAMAAPRQERRARAVVQRCTSVRIVTARSRPAGRRARSFSSM